MRYNDFCSNIIDVTKAPYFADNSGKTDCTAALRQAFDDCLSQYVTELEATKQELLDLASKQGGNVYIGAEAGKVIDGEVYITMPKAIPPSKIIFFPKGIYLVSDTVSYTFDNLSTRQPPNYTCELCRNIHILGEDRDSTVIRLADDSAGFGKDAKKPVVSFNRASIPHRETTNCAQQNTLRDICIDCGKGNPGAVGVLFASSNLGRIENVSIKAESGACGILLDYGSEGCIENLKVSGFDFGVETSHTSPLVFENTDLSENRLAAIKTRNGNLICKSVFSGELPLFHFETSENGRYFCFDKDISFSGDKTGNNIFFAEEDAVILPQTERGASVCSVDVFGAVGDGKTDATAAIQRALNSGCETVLFGSGTYLISRTLKIPASVKTLDFMFCDLVPGYSLLIGEMEACFEISENADAPLLIENLITKEDFNGFFRLVKHASERTLVLKDIFISAPLYFNTVPGGAVFFDNCFTHTNHYTQNCMPRDGYVPVFCRTTPIELHGQKAYAKNLNIERADLELLCDASFLTIDGFKTEGPGKMIRAIGGSNVQVNNYNSAWWGNKLLENEMFEADSSKMRLVGGNVFCFENIPNLRTLLRVTNGKNTERHDLVDLSSELSGEDALGRSWGRLIEKIEVK